MTFKCLRCGKETDVITIEHWCRECEQRQGCKIAGLLLASATLLVVLVVFLAWLNS